MGGTIKIGVSSCLLGEHVRYDAGHKRDSYITDVLGRFFEFVSVCPEVGAGLTIPREAMRLEGDPAAPRLMTTRSRTDLTERMLSFCQRALQELEREDLCGFIFKKGSPSSGLFRVKVYNKGIPAKNGRGLFADAIVKRFPLLPVEEEGRLHDDLIRGNFLERIFAFRRWKDFLTCGGGYASLIDFHTDHKLLILAHNPDLYRQMGKLVAHGKEIARADLLNSYQELFMRALSFQATVAKNTNVLQHIFGYFHHELSSAEKKEMLGLIEQYHKKIVPLVVPLTLLRHYVAKYNQTYLQRQAYLNPHPQELMLRNHM
jgi:uncharacterized protein YbgA (DUF1722 family)/uncharacterized protein YbbK (DUF523 family)